MKTKVNDKCIGCGTCVSLTDQKVFDFADDGRARCIVSVVPSDMEDIVRQAKDFCPAPDGGAIEIEESE